MPLAALFAGVLLIAGCGVSSNSAPPSTPSFTPPAGAYSASQTVTISDATEGAVLHCTTDGSTPTSSSPVCGEPTTVSKSETLSAIATMPGGGSSAVATAAYTINLPAAAAPVISPAAGTYTAAQTVTIADATAGASIYYTTDGTAPTASSTLYSGPIDVSASETINAIATAAGYTESAIATAAFAINLPAPAPVITPAGGTFTGAQSVTISDPIAGATIYYTLTPGSVTPTTLTTSSSVYSGPINVGASETVSAVAIAPGYSLSPVSAVTFSLMTATPVIAPAGGNFTSIQTIAISDATAGASIFYTVTPNGGAPVTPTSASTPYTGPIAVAASETIEAVAVAAGFNDSATASSAFSVTLPPAATPVISPAGGTFGSAQTVTITDATSNAAIYYTIDGSTPSASNGALYSGPITVSASETVQAVAAAYGDSNSAAAAATFTLVAATPVISPAGGTYTSVQSVTITDTTSGASIYYTTDGTLPSASSTLYAGPISVAATETVRAIAVVAGFTSSAVASTSFTINLPPAATPVITPAGGTFAAASEPTVTITDATAGAAIYYTLDGSVPSASNGLAYSAPFSVTASETVKAVAVASGHSTSAVATEVFTINQASAATPVFSPAAGTYNSAQSVSLTDATSHASIYYTTDGSTPAPTHGTLYVSGSPISVAATETLKAIAAASGFNNSAVATALFTINLPAAPTPVISPAAGTFSAAQAVTITDSLSAASIYYTVDGSTPTATHGTLYAGSFMVSTPETVNAVAVAQNYANSAVASVTYSFAVATPVIAPAGGTFTGTESVTITDATAGASIYYTVTAGATGTTPTSASTPYSGAFSISATDTVEAIAVKTGYTSSATASASFTLNTFTGPSVSGTVSSGTKPVIGASVQLYAAGTAGYGSAPAALGAPVTTGANGGFAIPYTCPAAPGDQIYVAAAGGSTSTTGPSNAGIGLMTALGSCSSLPTSSSITVNEVTTIASVYSLSGFAALATGGGINVGAPAPTVACAAGVGNATCNYPGLVNAFNTVKNLVNISSGTALASTPAYPVANQLPYLNVSTAPQARVDTLADILATCVDSAASCSTLFGDVGGAVPSDTIQAAFDIAQNPGTHVATLYGLLQTTPPYRPTLATTSTYGPGLTSAPVDFTLALTFTGGGLGVDPFNDFNDTLTNTALALDSAGNVWVTAINSNDSVGLIAGFNNLGAPLTPVTQYDPNAMYVTQFGGFGPATSAYPVDVGVSLLAVDPSNNLWVVSGSSAIDAFDNLSEVTVTPVAGMAPTLALSSANGDISLPQNGTSLAFDQAGDLWAATNSMLIEEYGSDGTFLNEYMDASALSGLGYFTFDSSGSLWAYDFGSHSALLFNPSNGNLISTFSGTGGALAAGASGNIYTCGPGQTSYLVFNSSNLTAPTSTYNLSAGCNPLVTDGAGDLWSVGGGNQPTVTEVSGTGTLLSPGTGYTGTSSPEAPTTYNATYLALDGSGNLWALNQMEPADGIERNVLVEFIGLATPAIPNLSVATQYGAQGTRP